MTKTENEIIAEFMGVEKRGFEGVEWMLYSVPQELATQSGFASNWVSLKHLKYDTSWDWLMPVCVKLKLEYICTDITKAYESIIKEIKRRNLEGHPGL